MNFYITYIIIFFFYITLINSSQNFKKISILSQNPHIGVKRSLIDGLKKLKISYNINPINTDDMGDVVFCLDSVSLLKKAIMLKQHNNIKKLIVGPNMLARTNMSDHILAHPAIDYYLTPSEWNKIICVEDEPHLSNTIRIWPAGIDADYWKPSPFKEDSNKVLIYWKTESQSFCEKVKEVVLNYGYEAYIIKYGNYTHDDYRSLLKKVKFAIFISKSESQGLALAECWAMNIPTLVWNPQEPVFYMGKDLFPINSAPYLTEKTGLSWKSIHDLESIFNNISECLSQCNPRTWVLEHMTDEKSVELLLKIINE